MGDSGSTATLRIGPLPRAAAQRRALEQPQRQRDQHDDRAEPQQRRPVHVAPKALRAAPGGAFALGRPGVQRPSLAAAQPAQRSLGVTMSVRRMPNLSFTTTTSPCAIR